jgi:hypothetical protein
MAMAAFGASATFGGTLNVEITGDLKLKALPTQERDTASLRLHGSIAMSDESHPSALREAIVDLDRNVSIDAEGLPVCRAILLRVSDVAGARRVCRKAIVGSGSARFGFVSSTQSPPTGTVQLRSELDSVASSRLTLFNGGVANGTVTLFIHALVSDPNPKPLVATVKIAGKGDGSQAVAKIPYIAEGRGSLLGFNLKLGRSFRAEGTERSYLAAKCPGGRLSLSIPALDFENEAEQAGVASRTVLKGTVSLPCVAGHAGS